MKKKSGGFPLQSMSEMLLKDQFCLFLDRGGVFATQVHQSLQNCITNQVFFIFLVKL